MPLIIDNTATPVLCQPLKHGAAIVMHSTTKYIGGHGTSIGGVIVDGGNFDWEKHAGALPDAQYARPELSRRGLDTSRQAARPDRLYHQGARDLAARYRRGDVSPFNAFMFIQGLETVVLRMREHCANASAVAEHLESHPKITKIIFPGA